MPDILLTTTQAAAALGLSRRRLRDLITADRLPILRAGRLTLIQEKDLERVRVRTPGRRKKKPPPQPHAA